MPPTKGRISICAPLKYSASRPVRITLCFKPAKIVPKIVTGAIVALAVPVSLTRRTPLLGKRRA